MISSITQVTKQQLIVVVARTAFDAHFTFNALPAIRANVAHHIFRKIQARRMSCIGFTQTLVRKRFQNPKSNGQT